MPLPDGLYDLLLTQRIEANLDPDRANIQLLKHNASELLADAIARQLAGILDDLPGADDPTKLNLQLELVNALLVTLRQRLKPGEDDNDSADIIDLIAQPPRMLKAINRNRQFPAPPDIGLSLPWLFTAGKGSPSLLHEIRRELSSCDSVDILVSFITVSGVRKLADVLQQITALGASGQSATRLRILTTTYTGATEARALDELARLPGCEIRVSLDGRRTRLHAKAWLFQRRSGFGSAYVGSANLSGAALTGGLEWTVKLTQRAQEALFARATAHFETLWEDNEFQAYDPANPEHRQALATALKTESFSAADAGAIPSFFDLQPKSYQQDMLEQLNAERAHGRWRNLVVAATGTGKTVVAAFDYRNTCRRDGGHPKLLFVAHREEILRQALRTYREVLRDPQFGELLTGRHEPARFDHLFATIDVLATRDLVATIGADHWHTVVIDECHRLAANRFDAFATAVRPRLLLGLTATPERSDGQPISQHFDARPDGSPAVELRLWHALDLQLLAPFEYYACDDATDFSDVPWDRPGEREAVDNLITGNDVRARLVVNEWRRLASDPAKSRALVFCVSVAHATFMTDWLNRAGLPAALVVGSTPGDERRRAPQLLNEGKLCALVTVDLYNEGIDLPQVDTLLLLRPTQSPVLFQQQIGRGLRLWQGKESCLVLDFVGQHRADFRFDRLLSSLTGLSRRALVDSVENGFGSLPPGCHIQLQRQTREQVLQSLRLLTKQNWRRLQTELQTYAALRGRAAIKLADFIHEQSLELEDIYRNSGRSGWTALKRDAGLMVSEPGPEEDYLSRRMASLLHIDDPVRLDQMTRIAHADSEPESAVVVSGSPERSTLDFVGSDLSERFGSALVGSDLSERSSLNLVGSDLSERSGSASVGSDLSERSGFGLDPHSALLTQMLAYQIDGGHAQPASHHAFLERLTHHAPIAQELTELSGILQARSTLPFTPISGLEDAPLCLHAAYGIREILTAVGWLTANQRAPFQSGVLPIKARKTELLFVTLDKSTGYHDRIAYHDYAISPDRFHWQTQNSAGPDTKSGRRYLESATNGWQFQLFVRTNNTQPYRSCGRVILESVAGDRPMSITWRLATPLSARMFREFSVLRAA